MTTFITAADRWNLSMEWREILQIKGDEKESVRRFTFSRSGLACAVSGSAVVLRSHHRKKKTTTDNNRPTMSPQPLPRRLLTRMPVMHSQSCRHPNFELSLPSLLAAWLRVDHVATTRR